MSLKLTLLIILSFIVVYTNGSYHLLHYSSCSFHHFNSNVFFLFSRCDSPTCFGLRPFLDLLDKYFSSWHVSAQRLSSSSIGNKISCFRSLFHRSRFQSLSSSHFTPNSSPPFSGVTPWLSSIFNSQPFSLFTTDNMSLSQDSHSSIPFHKSLLQSFVQHTVPFDLQVDTSIINPHYYIPEPQLISSNTRFNGWF